MNRGFPEPSVVDERRLVSEMTGVLKYWVAVKTERSVYGGWNREAWYETETDDVGSVLQWAREQVSDDSIVELWLVRDLGEVSEGAETEVAGALYGIRLATLEN